MTHLLIKTCHDWADEFDCVSAFCILKEKYEADLEKIKAGFADGSITHDDEFYFGTNEALQFANFEDFMSGVETIEVTQEFAETFGDLVGFDIFDQLVEHTDNNNEEDDD